jgi:hypothetical protein
MPTDLSRLISEGKTLPLRDWKFWLISATLVLIAVFWFE